MTFNIFDQTADGGAHGCKFCERKDRLTRQASPLKDLPLVLSAFIV